MHLCDERGAAGFSWITDGPATRTSHALAAGGRVWLVDPVEWPDAIELARSLGEPAAVLQLLDRHNRDCASIAARLGIPHLMTPAVVQGSPFQLVDVLRWKRWREVAVWWAGEETLVVAEALGTNPFFPVGDDLIGVHGLLKLLPPRRQLGGFAPQHLLVGHGEGLHGAVATDQLRRALDRSRAHLLTWGAALPLRIRRTNSATRGG